MEAKLENFCCVFVAIKPCFTQSPQVIIKTVFKYKQNVIYKFKTGFLTYLYILFLHISNAVIPAVLGLTAAAILAVSACFCARRIRARNKKLNNDAGLSFQPPRRPTAVRSPSGQQTHYLKKSPSPTATKPLPGTLLTPSEPVLPHHPIHSKYIEENEISPKNSVMSSEIEVTDIEPSINDEIDNGKLGSLVFKLRYLTDRNALVVSVVRCRGLPGKTNTNSEIPAGANGKVPNATDPYVKLQLLPEKQHKVKTR